MKKKIYSKAIAVLITITAAIMVGTIGKNIVSAAEIRQIFVPKSYGRFIYDDDDTSNNNGHKHDILIDALDFADIAENLNGLTGITDELAETSVRKNDVIDTLEEIKENTEKDKAAGANAVKELIQAFQNGVNKIYDKLVGLGFTPITNSPDDINNTIQDIYDSRYAQGYADGLGQAQSDVAKIIYTYHEHTGDSHSCGGCYTVPVRCNSDWDYTGQEGEHYGCKAHGHSIDYMDGYRCSYIMGYSLGCGMSTNTIIGAVIDFE